MMQIKVGDYDVFYQGTIVCNKDEPVDFLIAEEIGFIIRIIFEDDSTTDKYGIFAEKFEKVGALLKFINYNNPLGIGNGRPTPIGTLNDRELLFNYRVYSLENAGKTLHFTWLLGKEVKNGSK